MSNQGYLQYTKSSPNTQKVFKCSWRIRGKNLCVHGEDAKRLLAYSHNTKRHKSMYISVNNNTNKKFFLVLSIYTRWDGLSQNTIPRYCPFKGI